jgi:uncharacterized membrane protein YraQ (UPF0718 family)
MLSEILFILQRSGYLLLEFLPYILAGILLAEILKYTPWTKFVQKAVSKSPKVSIIIASFIGIISPLCTYGTIPIVIDLYKNKVPLAPLLTFLSASALMNPQLFIITWGGLGLEFSLLRIFGVVIFTLILGFALIFIEKRYLRNSDKSINKKFTRQQSTEKNWKDFNLKEFSMSFYNTFVFIGFYILIGILISVIIETFVPLSQIFEMTEGVGWINVIAASILGIPLYACGGATIPLISVLLENGVSFGAAMGFLIVGPGTRITPLLALGSFLSKRTLVYYCFSLLIFSIFFGLLINSFLGF